MKAPQNPPTRCQICERPIMASVHSHEKDCECDTKKGTKAMKRIKEYFDEWGAFWLIAISTVIIGLIIRDDFWNWITK